MASFAGRAKNKNIYKTYEYKKTILLLLAPMNSITSFPGLRRLFLPVFGYTATELIHQAIYWYEKMGRPFFKFMEPCNHRLYSPGDSWEEELCFSARTIRRALKAIGAKITKGTKLAEAMAGSPMITYYTTRDRLTFFTPNFEVIAGVYQYLLSKREGQKTKEIEPVKVDPTGQNVRYIDQYTNSLREGEGEEESLDKIGDQSSDPGKENPPEPITPPILKPKFNNLAEIQASLEPQYGVYWLPAARSMGLIREKKESDPVEIEEKLAWIKKLPAKITMTTIAHLNDLETWEVELIALRLLHRLNSGKNAIIRNVSAYLNHSLARAIKFDPSCNPGELERLRKSFGY
jgi:hypothetical protein